VKEKTSRGKEFGISKSSVTDRVKNAWQGIRNRVRAWGHKVCRRLAHSQVQSVHLEEAVCDTNFRVKHD
jgi:chromosome condensin MukBEF ATPase and DNA-binding subunit MukB